MSNLTALASPDNNNPLALQYERHVKRCIVDNRNPMDPESWLRAVAAIEGFPSTDAMGAVSEPEQVLEPKKPVKLVQRRESEIRAKFMQMMIDEGMVKSIGVVEQARHLITMGPERPMTVKQTKPCEMCGDILCRWAR